MGVNVNNKTRFATGGARAQRLNPDGTIPRPGRVIGFHGTIDLRYHTSNGMSELTIKVGSHDAQTRSLDFSTVADLARVTVAEVVDAINNAGFTDSAASIDPDTGRLRVGAAGITPARLTVELMRGSGDTGAATLALPAFMHRTAADGATYRAVNATATWAEGAQESSPVELIEDGTVIVREFPFPMGSWMPPGQTMVPWPMPAPATGVRYRGFAPTVALPGTNGIIQVVGSLASALDFGQGRRFGGDLRCLSFFDDEIINIGLAKNARAKEEIDQEGANGTITRMLIGAMMQGIDPVLTLREKNYDLLELVQGGLYNRQTGTYDPPMAHESDHPGFWIEILSPVYGRGTNQRSDVSGYERILIRNCTGIEGDVPVEAKAWAQYAYNIAATEYTDETGARFPAWQEQFLTVAQFDALEIRRISIPGIGDLYIGENLSAAESRAASLSAFGGGLDAASRSVGTCSAETALARNLERMNKEQLAAYATNKGIAFNADGTKTEILAAIREGSGE